MTTFEHLVFRIPFIARALREAKLQGGIEAFSLAQKDIFETMRDDLDAQAEELSQRKLEQLLTVVDERLVITFDSRTGAVFIGGVKATNGQLLTLKQEAELIERLDLWGIIYESVKQLAEKALFKDGDNLDTMKKGRAILYTLDTQQRIINTLQSYEKK